LAARINDAALLHVKGCTSNLRLAFRTLFKAPFVTAVAIL
jgi:hypothetical protein